MKNFIYKMQDYKHKHVYHKAKTVRELIDTISKYHKDEYVRWSLENWRHEDFDKYKMEE